MARIVLRAHKDPFRVVSPQQAYRANLIGDNVGNLLFSNASYKLLGTRGTQIETSPMAGGAAEAAHINQTADHVVIPLANAFRLSYTRGLDALTELIEALTVPVTVLGVGAQLNLDGNPARLDRMKDSVVRFVRAVLDHSPTIGVRGELTERYLRGLGFSDVEVIGCPSLFLHGPEFAIAKRNPGLTRESRISLNLSPYVPGMEALIAHHVEKYPRLQYAAQHRDALGLLLDRNHRSKEFASDVAGLPTHHGHPLVASGRSRFFVDPKPWMDNLSTFDFSFGTRIHGNIAALLARTPAYVLAHDSRTLELARYFEIPHRTMRRVTERTDAADLYDEADFTAFNAGHRERFDRFAGFFASQGLSHVYQPGEDSMAFDRRVASIAYPAGIGGALATPSTETRSLLRRLPSLVRRPIGALA